MADALRPAFELLEHVVEVETEIHHRVVAVVVLPERIVVGDQTSVQTLGLRQRLVGGLHLEALKVGQRQVVVVGRELRARGRRLDRLLVAADRGREIAPCKVEVCEVVDRDPELGLAAQHVAVEPRHVLVAPGLPVHRGQQEQEIPVAGIRLEGRFELPDRASVGPVFDGRDARPEERVARGLDALLQSVDQGADSDRPEHQNERNRLLDGPKVDEEHRQPPEGQPSPTLKGRHGQKQHGGKESEADGTAPARSESLTQVVEQEGAVPNQHRARESHRAEEGREEEDRGQQAREAKLTLSRGQGGQDAGEGLPRGPHRSRWAAGGRHRGEGKVAVRLTGGQGNGASEELFGAIAFAILQPLESLAHQGETHDGEAFDVPFDPQAPDLLKDAARVLGVTRPVRTHVGGPQRLEGRGGRGAARPHFGWFVLSRGRPGDPGRDERENETPEEIPPHAPPARVRAT